MAFEVFDPTGKVRGWLAEGVGVKVWRNLDLSSASVGEIAFTRGDSEGAPHWKYGATPEAVSSDPADFVFWEKVGLAYCSQNGGHGGSIRPRTLFTDSAAGFKAAYKAADALADTSATYDAPIGRVSHTFTVERLHMASEEKRADGRALASQSFAAVIEWSLIVRTPEAN